MATLSAVAATLAACGGGAEAGLTGPVPPGVGEISVKVSDFTALNAVGGVAKVRNSPPVAVARTAASTYVAFSMSCTHQGTTVIIDDDGTIFCPNHGAEFTSLGVWTGGQRTSNLVRLPVSVDATGNATITLG
ncbi:MAG: Rieske (2Fe-2S) protein [Gemmatimonadaceae bacterium]|nr:Rieske (2Fe-2S) protein [Gemmatimonadaceae bacterium]